MLLQPPLSLYNLDDYSKLQLHCFQTIHTYVREKLKASREEMLQRQHLHATPINIGVGDSVMKSSPEWSCKLVPKFSGPYLITAKMHGNTFKVLNPNNNVSEVFHADHLKKVRSAPQPVAAPSPPLSTDSPPVSTGPSLQSVAAPPSLSTDSPPVSTDPSPTDASSTQYRLKLKSASRQL